MKIAARYVGRKVLDTLSAMCILAYISNLENPNYSVPNRLNKGIAH